MPERIYPAHGSTCTHAQANGARSRTEWFKYISIRARTYVRNRCHTPMPPLFLLSRCTCKSAGRLYEYFPSNLISTRLECSVRITSHVPRRIRENRLRLRGTKGKKHARRGITILTVVFLKDRLGTCTSHVATNKSHFHPPFLSNFSYFPPFSFLFSLSLSVFLLNFSLSFLFLVSHSPLQGCRNN